MERSINLSERPTLRVPTESGLRPAAATRVAVTIDVVACDLSYDRRSEDYPAAGRAALQG